MNTIKENTGWYFAIKHIALNHYDRMYEWAIKQNPDATPNPVEMEEAIKENWSGKYCSYCNITYIRCKLGKDMQCEGGRICCNGLWWKMHRSSTWHKWAINNRLVRNYIEKNG